MKKQFLIIIIALVIIGAAAALTGLFFFPYDPMMPPRANDAGSTDEGILRVVNANNEFAFDLYSELIQREDGNIFYSPYSISAALAMTYEGARGETADEIRSVFHFPETDVLRPNFAAIYNSVNERSRHYESRTGNALWVQRDFELLQDYTSRVSEYYGGRAANLDFIGQSESSRQTINNFIEEQTNNRIKNLIPAGALNQYTRLVITNAIFFKGTWETEFEEKNTRDEDFRVTQDTVVRAPLMHMIPRDTRFNYGETEDLQILELPYKGDKFSMLVLLPKENLEALEPTLSSEKLEEYKSGMRKTLMQAIYIPKFKFDTDYQLTQTLQSMGMPTAFNESQADFSGMDGTRNLSISDVFHKAFVEVNEEGTEAAAATAVMMEVTTSIPPPKPVFRADHPFIFIIQQKDTGNILFIGRVTDPT